MAKAVEPPTVYIVLDSFTDGSTIWTKGTLLHSDDPATAMAVRKWPHNFRPYTFPGVRSAPAIEQATAAPGEKRDI